MIAFSNVEEKLLNDLVSESELIQKRQNLSGIPIPISTFTTLFTPVFKLFNIELADDATLFHNGFQFLLTYCSKILQDHQNSLMIGSLISHATSRMDERLNEEKDFEIGNVCSVLRFILPLLWICVHYPDEAVDIEVIENMRKDLSIPDYGKVSDCLLLE